MRHCNFFVFDQFLLEYSCFTTAAAAAKSFSRVRLFATPWTAAYQAPLSMGLSRQEYWSGVPLPSPIVQVKHVQIKQQATIPFDTDGKECQSSEKLLMSCCQKKGRKKLTLKFSGITDIGTELY